MAQHGDEIWRMIRDCRAGIFVAGNAKQMPADVIARLRAIVADRIEERDDGAAAGRFIEELERTGRLQFETWS